MLSEGEIVVRLLLAAVLAAIIGWERETLKKPAGLRTHMLVATSSALMTLVSIDAIEGGDPARIAAGIVTGIGFLGAGTIFRDKDHVRGLTTAASVWAVAGVGIGIGAGYYLASIITAALMLLTLRLRTSQKKAGKR